MNDCQCKPEVAEAGKHECCGKHEHCEHGLAKAEVKLPAAEGQSQVKSASRQPRSIDEKDVRRLNTNGYEEKSKRFNTAFVLMHNKTGKLAELWAASSVHACTMLRWNPKHTTLLRTRTRVVEKEPVKTGGEKPVEAIVVPTTPIVGEFIPNSAPDSVWSK